jgi:DNA adenine methylase
MESFGSTASGGGALSSRAARMEAIRQLNIRLDNVSIENLSWEKCIDLYDRPHTCFFLDPPYTSCNATMYDTWTLADVQRVRDSVARLRGSWIVTFNDCAPIRAVFKGCRIRSVERQKGISNGSEKYSEIIITPQKGR